MGRWETQLRKGVVELAVLASIGRGETYGYRIVESSRSSKGLELTESTVYPVLDASGSGRVSGGPRHESPERADATLLSTDSRRTTAPSPDGGELEDGFAISQCLD